MEDLKLYIYNKKKGEELESLLSTVKMFSDNIRMLFGLEKCAKVSFKKGLLTKYKNIILETNMNVRVRTQ